MTLTHLHKSEAGESPSHQIFIQHYGSSELSIHTTRDKQLKR